jgi:prepilin peptidase CpaA
MFELAILLIFPAAMAFAAATDLLTMTISNKVSLLLIVSFLALALLTGMDLKDFGLHLAAGGLVLVVSFVLFSFGWVGGGDAKLASTTALWLGWPLLVEYIGLASLFGGLLTLVVLYIRGTLPPSFLYRQDWFTRLAKPETGIPYGIALAASGLAVYPASVWMTSALH